MVSRLGRIGLYPFFRPFKPLSGIFSCGADGYGRGCHFNDCLGISCVCQLHAADAVTDRRYPGS